MAYVEKLLNVGDLLAAWQNRNMRDGNRGNESIQRQAAEQQIEAQKIANDKAKYELGLVQSQFNIPRESWAGSGNANTPGLDKFLSDDMASQKISQLTGRARPSQGISGYGGGGYGRGRGGGEEEPQVGNRVLYAGPEAPKLDTAGAAAALGEIYRPGGQDIPQATSPMSELLVDERNNAAGLQSLLDQRGGVSPQVQSDMMAGTEPIQAAIDKKAANDNIVVETFLDQGGTSVPPGGLSPEQKLAAVRIKNIKKDVKEQGKSLTKKQEKEKSEMDGYYKELYKTKEYVGTAEDPTPPEIQTELENLLPKYVAFMKKRGKVPNVNQLASYLKK